MQLLWSSCISTQRCWGRNGTRAPLPPCKQMGNWDGGQSQMLHSSRDPPIEGMGWLAEGTSAPEKGYHVRKRTRASGFLGGRGDRLYPSPAPLWAKRVMPLRRTSSDQNPAYGHFRKTSLLEPVDVCSAGVCSRPWFFVFYSTMIQTFPLM